MNTGLTVFHNYKDKIMSSGNRKWTDTAKQCGLSFHDVQLHMMIMHIIFSYSPLLFRKKKKCKKLFSLRKYTKKKKKKRSICLVHVPTLFEMHGPKLCTGGGLSCCVRCGPLENVSYFSFPIYSTEEHPVLFSEKTITSACDYLLHFFFCLHLIVASAYKYVLLGEARFGTDLQAKPLEAGDPFCYCSRRKDGLQGQICV